MLLLDTNVVYRWLMAEPLPQDLVERVQREGGAVSIVSPWELLIKHQIGKLDLPTIDVAREIQGQGFVLLAIQPAHLRILGELPLVHRDPFDRLIVAQAKSEGLTVVTTDKIFSDYIPEVWTV